MKKLTHVEVDRLIQIPVEMDFRLFIYSRDFRENFPHTKILIVRSLSVDNVLFFLVFIDVFFITFVPIFTE